MSRFEQVLFRVVTLQWFRIGTCDMPSKVCSSRAAIGLANFAKEEAVRGLIQSLQMYPADTMFYIYTWCTGCVTAFVAYACADIDFSYEEVLKAIAMIFGVKVSPPLPKQWRTHL